MPTVAFTAAAVALLGAAPVAAAEFYKWVDSDGVTHYSQQPPPPGAQTIIDGEPLNAPAGNESDADQNAASDDSAGSDSDSAEDDAQTQSLASFCKDLRGREKLIASDRPLRTRTADDQLKPLTGEERTQRLQQVRQQIERNCSEDNSTDG